MTEKRQRNRNKKPAIPEPLRITPPGRRPDPIDKAARSAEAAVWVLRPDLDVRRLTSRAIRRYGRDRSFWIQECMRAGLAQLAGAKDAPYPPILINPTTFKK